tara:strand:+ start:54 stop:431 length:378 start_codon:yes stop_codon:yes gene_type:complete
MKLNNVVAAVIKKENYYFIAQRNKRKYMGLKWEFPGGKVDPGETFEEALGREIKEELNIKINIFNKIAEEKFNDHSINIIIHYYLCSMENELIELLEHNQSAWVKKNEFYKYSFVPGDDKILSLL